MAVYHPTAGRTDKPIVVLTWLGAEPQLPSVLLNSHMDVVPVFADNWTHPPFGADIDADGRIFARGSQDMKCVGVQYLAAIRALKADGIVQLKRTVHVMFVPGKYLAGLTFVCTLYIFSNLIDEETGGELGMRVFINTAEFRALNVAFALDEGIASPTDVFSVYFAERSIWSNYKPRIYVSNDANYNLSLLQQRSLSIVMEMPDTVHCC